MKVSPLKTLVFSGVKILALAAVAYGGTDSAGTDSEANTESYDGPMISESMNQLAIRASTRNREFIDATIQQNGREISLALDIECAESEEAAKKTARYLWTELLRIIKQFGPDSNPTPSEVGTGDFDYLVGVSCADGTTVATGVKSRDSAEIVW